MCELVYKFSRLAIQTEHGYFLFKTPEFCLIYVNVEANTSWWLLQAMQ